MKKIFSLMGIKNKPNFMDYISIIILLIAAIMLFFHLIIFQNVNLFLTGVVGLIMYLVLIIIQNRMRK
ncbi:hypothetical protein BK133_27820 [Paenibacillus sp. FSL H8-0548]|nr:hypothetical protein BK133_27820 [Paenibacillus sp. FSL H8-0548]